MKISEKRTNLLVGLCCVLAFVCVVVTQQYCTWHMPEVAMPEIGRVIPLEANYGKTVYLTDSESYYVRLVYGTAVALGAAALAVVLWRSWQTFKEAIEEEA